MFSTCCFCHAPLGANDCIEHFPVGQRLAFDGERGRLWAVCPRCARWNLAPIEERWEALEECERAYRNARQRVSTDHIALARLRDGTDLVRIGRPLLPEFAAWRYGRQLRARWRRSAAGQAGAYIGVNTALAAALTALGVGGGSLLVPIAAPLGASALVYGVIARRERRVSLRVEHEAGWLGLSSRDVGRLRLQYDEVAGLRVLIPGDVPRRRAATAARPWQAGAAAPAAHVVQGEDAHALLRQALAVTNAGGAPTRLVAEAVARRERFDAAREGADPVLAMLAPRLAGYRGSLFGTGEPLELISPINRLAAEIALHEEDERRALAGELGALHARWEEAERVARITDGELARRSSAD